VDVAEKKITWFIVLIKFVGKGRVCETVTICCKKLWTDLMKLCRIGELHENE